MGETKKFFSMAEPVKKNAKKAGGAALKASEKNILEAVEREVKTPDKIQDFKLVPVAGTKNIVFIQPVKPSKMETTASGFVIVKEGFGIKKDEASEDKKWEYYGRVFSVSDCDELGILPNTQVDDVVYFEQNFREKEFEGVTYLVMKEGNIYAKLKK